MSEVPDDNAEFRIAPLSSKWMGRTQAAYMLGLWMEEAPDRGAPSTTVSKRAKAPTPTRAPMPQESCDACDHPRAEHSRTVGCLVEFETEFDSVFCACTGFKAPETPDAS